MKTLITWTFALILNTGTTFGQTGLDFNNFAVVEQTNTGNSGDIVQRESNNESHIGQGKFDRPLPSFYDERPRYRSGTDKNGQAFVGQVGDENLSFTGQGFSDGTAVRQKSKIVQHGNDNGGGMTSRELSGRAEDNQAVMNQQGDGNIHTRIGQGIEGSIAIKNSALIRRSGNANNQVFILQGEVGGTARRNDAAIRQPGNENAAHLFQGQERTAINNSGKIVQPGNLNDANILQGSVQRDTEAPAGLSLSDSEATIIQRSNNNSAIIDQTGTYQSAPIVQSN